MIPSQRTEVPPLRGAHLAPLPPLGPQHPAGRGQGPVLRSPRLRRPGAAARSRLPELHPQWAGEKPQNLQAGSPWGEGHTQNGMHPRAQSRVQAEAGAWPRGAALGWKEGP